MGLKFPKISGPRPRRALKALRLRRLRPGVRAEAWEADEGRCVFPSCRRWIPLEAAHIHETQARGATSGHASGDPCDLNIAVTVCRDCHHDMHVRVGGKRKRIEGSRREGLQFFQRINSEWIEVPV